METHSPSLTRTETHQHECSRLLCMPYILYKDTVLSVDAQSRFLQAKRRIQQSSSLQHRALMTLFEKSGA